MTGSALSVVLALAGIVFILCGRKKRVFRGRPHPGTGGSDQTLGGSRR